MKSFRIILLLTTCMVLFSCSQQKFISTKWQKKSFGQIDSIPVFDYLYDRDHKVFYMITNDNHNLYIHLRAIDKSAQRQILNNGLTVWVDTTAKNKENVGLKYPIAKKDILTQKPMRTNGSRGGVRSVHDIENQLLDIELIGFDGKEISSIIPPINQYGIRGTIKFTESDVLLYALAVPINELWNSSTIDNKVFSLKIESGISNSEGNSERPQSSMAMRGGGRGKGQRSGGGGPRGGGSKGGGYAPDMRTSQGNTPLKINLKKMKLISHEE